MNAIRRTMLRRRYIEADPTSIPQPGEEMFIIEGGRKRWRLLLSGWERMYWGTEESVETKADLDHCNEVI